MVFSIDCVPVNITSDATLLEQILRNLLNNAIKYTERGSITIRVVRTGDAVTIAISDTGIGIDKSHQEAIFEEFYQVDNSQRSSEKGLGLGLAIVRRLAELLGHRLNLESSPGHGTTFSIIVPASAGQAPVHDSGVKFPHNNDNILGLNVWVIEDNLQVADAQRALLEKWGCECTVFFCMADIMHALQCGAKQPHAILADFKLQADTNGAELIEIARKHFGKEIPALILTGDTSPAQLREIEAFGIGVLHKPTNPDSLKRFLIESAETHR